MTKSCKDCVVRIFGACRGEYCQPERIGLSEQAEREAAARGHVLGSFKKMRHYPIWQARCKQCGRIVAYTLDPAPGEPAIYGEALTVTCPKSAPQPASASATGRGRNEA
jgi:hypothetical protein